MEYDAAVSGGQARLRRPWWWLAIIAMVALLFAAFFGASRWSQHQRHVAVLRNAAQRAERATATYRRLTDRIEARRRAYNHLLERLIAAQDRARNSPMGGLSVIGDRMDALRHGDRLDDVAAYARANLPTSEMRVLERDFTVLLKRQEDANDAVQVVSSTLHQALANPWARLAFTASDGEKMWKGYRDADHAFSNAFEKMQDDVYARYELARREAHQSAAAADELRRVSLLGALLNP